MHLKSALAATLLSASLAAPAFANESQPADLPQFSAVDMQIMFERDVKPMQLAVLSQQEMKETEGAWLWAVPVIGYGLYGGGLSYTSYGAATGDWTSPQAAYNLWTGFAGGAIGSYGGFAGATAGSWLGSYWANSW